MWRPPLSLVLGGCCRLSGLAAALLVARVCLSRGLAAPPSLAVLQVGASVLLAILVGNLIKELIFAVVESLVTACGSPFVRNSLTVTGRRVTELWLPDGTWVRCESWRNGATLTWTQSDGSCSEIAMPALTVARAQPPRSRATPEPHDPLHGRLQSAALSAGSLERKTFLEATRIGPLETGLPVRVSRKRCNGYARVLTPP